MGTSSVASASARRWWSRWPEVVVLAAVAAAFFPTLSGASRIPFDAQFFHYPLLRTVQQMLSSGHLPGWDQFSYGGVPLLANAQSAWLYPPHLLLDAVLAAIGKPLTEHTLDVLAVLHVAVAGLGTAAVARARKLGEPAAAFAGVFVVLNGATVAQAQHVLMTETLAWVPLAVLAVDKLAIALTGRRVAALAVLVALMITAGFTPLIPACAVLLLGCAVARGAGRRLALLGTVAGIVAGILLAAAALVPTVAVLGAFPPLEAHHGLPTAGLLTVVLPDAFGHWPAAQAAYSGPPGADLTATYLYMGGGALALLPLALTSGRQAIRESVLVAVLLLASFGAVATDIASPIQSLPVVGHLWRPEDVLYVATVPFGLLLARGLSCPASWLRLAAAAVALAVFVAIPLSGSHGEPLHALISAPAQTWVAFALVGAALVAARVFYKRYRAASMLALAAAAVIACIDLAAAVPDRYFVNASGRATNAGPDTTGDGSPVVAALKPRLRPGERIAADIDNLPAVWVGFSPVWRLSDANGFQPQFSKYQLARVEATGASFEGRNRTFPIVPAVRDYLAEMDVRFVVVSPAADRFAHVPGYSRVYADPLHRVYRLDATLARAYAVSPACVRSRGPYAVTQCRRGPAVNVELSSQATRTLRIDSPGGVPLLITGEPWYPGWTAQAQHRALGVKRIGYLAAITVPRGVTSVTLTYSPPGLPAGAAVSVLAILGLLVFAGGRGPATPSRVSRLRGRSAVQVHDVDGPEVTARDRLERVKVVPERRE